MFVLSSKDHFRKDDIKEKMDDLETQWMQLKVRDLERNTCLITINFTLVNILHTNLQRFKFPGHKRAEFLG